MVHCVGLRATCLRWRRRFLVPFQKSRPLTSETSERHWNMPCAGPCAGDGHAGCGYDLQVFVGHRCAGLRGCEFEFLHSSLGAAFLATFVVHVLAYCMFDFNVCDRESKSSLGVVVAKHRARRISSDCMSDIILNHSVACLMAIA